MSFSHPLYFHNQPASSNISNQLLCFLYLSLSVDLILCIYLSTSLIVPIKSFTQIIPQRETHHFNIHNKNINFDIIYYTHLYLLSLHSLPLSLCPSFFLAKIDYVIFSYSENALVFFLYFLPLQRIHCNYLQLSLSSPLRAFHSLHFSVILSFYLSLYCLIILCIYLPTSLMYPP